MSDLKDRQILRAQALDSQGMYYLGDAVVVREVIRDSDRPLRSLDDATRQGKVLQIQNVDQLEDLGGTVFLELIVDEPLPARLAGFSRLELTGGTLQVSEGRLLLAPAAMLNNDVLDVESPDCDAFLAQLRNSSTTVEVFPGVYGVEVYSLHYGLGERTKLVESQLSESELDDWKRRDKARNAGCAAGCLGAFFAAVAAGVAVSVGNPKLATWMAVAGAILIALGSLQFWIVGRNPRYKQLKQLFDDAQIAFPHGIVKLTPATTDASHTQAAKCGWVFGD